MLRLGSKTMVSSLPKLIRGNNTQTSVRHASSGGSGRVKIVGTTLVISAGAVGGTVGYSAIDPDFRKLVEDSIPGSNMLIELVLGGKEPVSPPKPVPSKVKISSPLVITHLNVEDQPAKSVSISASPPELPAVVNVSPILLDVPVPSMTIPSSPMEVPAPPVEVPALSMEVPAPSLEVPAPSLEVPAPSMEVPSPSMEVPSPSMEVPAPSMEVPAQSMEAPAPPVEVPAPSMEVPAPPMEVPPISDIEVTALTEIPAPLHVNVPAVVESSPISAVDEVVNDEEILSETKETSVKVAEESTPPLALDLSYVEAPQPEIPDIENISLDEVLVELCKEMQEVVISAVTEYEASSEAVVNHISIMQKVLESNLTVKDDSAWNEMFLAAQAKSDKAKAAEKKENEAMVVINNVVDSIYAGRKNKVTSINPQLVVAEEAANRAIYKLDQAKARKAAVQSEARVMEEYRDLVEAGREQFHKEMASIMPDVKLGEKNGKLTEDELNMFITHAYKKVLFLQQEVAKQQTLEQERFKKALEKQRMETETLVMEQVEGELERQARELRVEHEKKMITIREDAEAELRAQLKRQAAAHTDHLTDVQSVQEAELTRHHKHRMDEQVDSLTETQLTCLASLSGTVSGLESALEARAEADTAALTAQALWVACNNLNTTLNMGKLEAATWEEKLQPLVKEVKNVMMVAGTDDKFVEVLLASISPVALDRGVYTEDSLKERFCVVEKTARKVAGIGEEGGSLLAFGLSYLQSLLIVDTSHRTPVDNMELLDLNYVSATDLVTLAKHNLDRGNLARAVQLMSQLKGEPGRVVMDWVSEARLTLETRQVVEAMMVHSLATSCQALPGV